MARVPQVTRTIKTTKVLVKAVDIENDKMVDMEFILPRTYKDDNAILKAVSKVHKNENMKIVKVMHKDVEEALYGMTEEEFIKSAHIISK